MPEKRDTPTGGKVSIDPQGPIDFDALKARTGDGNPYVLTNNASGTDFAIRISSSMSGSGESAVDLIVVAVSSGLVTLATMISRNQLEDFPNLTTLARVLTEQPKEVYDAEAEQQYIEDEARKHLGIEATEITSYADLNRKLDSCLSEVAERDLWRFQNIASALSSIYFNKAMLGHVDTFDLEKPLGDQFDSLEEFGELLRRQYNLGFLAARLLSNYHYKAEHEPFTFKGIKFEEAQKKRQETSGQSSADAKHERIEAMLSIMEAIVSSNPDVRRFGLENTAKVAMQKAAEENPALWTRGLGQRDAYLDEMRADQRYAPRFKKLQKKFP